MTRRYDEPPRPPRGEDPDTDLLREMIGFAARRLMEPEVGRLTGAAYGEKTPERLAQRRKIAIGLGDGRTPIGIKVRRRHTT